MVFDSEQAMTVLMEFTVFDFVRDGATAIQRYAQSHAASADPDEQRYLSAACSGEYNVYGVQERIPGVGAIIRTLSKAEPRLLIDLGLGTTAVPGLILACRLLCLGDYWMTTGAVLAASSTDFIAIARNMALAGLAPGDDRKLPPQDQSRRNATIIRAFLDAGASQSVRYLDHKNPVGSLREIEEEMAVRRPAPPVGRYDPCPCGSGKKFKFCCAALYRSGQTTF